MPQYVRPALFGFLGSVSTSNQLSYSYTPDSLEEEEWADRVVAECVGPTDHKV